MALKKEREIWARRVGAFIKLMALAALITGSLLFVMTYITPMPGPLAALFYMASAFMVGVGLLALIAKVKVE
jgi:vacuolar-type H+-ATPase subunit I/STV1